METPCRLLPRLLTETLQNGRPLFTTLCFILFSDIITAHVKRSDRTTKSKNTCPLTDVDPRDPEADIRLRCVCVTPPDCSLDCNRWTYACPRQFTGGSYVIQQLDSGMDDIEVLDLSFNNITSIKNPGFSNARISNLTVLRLANNQLKVLRKGSFAPLMKLEYLDLSKNNISAVPGNIFVRLTSLLTLRLDRNVITKLGADCFNKLGNLEELHLEYNQLKTLGGRNRFNKLNNLKELRVSHNQLTKTFTAFYKGSSNLEFLDLSYNKIRTISPRSFVTFPKLRWLHLEGNPLTTKTVESAFTNANLIFWFSVVNDNTVRWVEVVNGTGVTVPEQGTTSATSPTENTPPSITEPPIPIDNTHETTAAEGLNDIRTYDQI